MICTTFRSDFHFGWKNQNKHSTLNSSFDALFKWHEPDIGLKILKIHTSLMKCGGKLFLITTFHRGWFGLKIKSVILIFHGCMIMDRPLEFLQRSHFEGVHFVDKLANVQINCCKQVISIQGEFVIWIVWRIFFASIGCNKYRYFFGIITEITDVKIRALFNTVNNQVGYINNL